MKELDKMSKAELYAEMDRLKGKAETVTDKKRLRRYKQRLKMVRRHFYECRLCADAEIETYINFKGEEKDRFIRDCGLEKCPYHDYFMDLANGIEDVTTRVLDRLHRCLDGF